MSISASILALWGGLGWPDAADRPICIKNRFLWNSMIPYRSTAPQQSLVLAAFINQTCQQFHFHSIFHLIWCSDSVSHRSTVKLWQDRGRCLYLSIENILKNAICALWRPATQFSQQANRAWRRLVVNETTNIGTNQEVHSQALTGRHERGEVAAQSVHLQEGLCTREHLMCDYH